MFIKCIVLEGFKNYKDRVVLTGLSPCHNVVGVRVCWRAEHNLGVRSFLLACVLAVGANGAGKSNFFAG